MGISRRPHHHRPGHLHGGLSALLLALVLPSLQAAEPSRWLIQETPTTAAAGHINIDLLDQIGPALRPTPSLVRVGVRRGEWQISAQTLGFKYPTGRNHAVYGRLGLDTGAGRSEATAGLSWSLGEASLAINLNGELRKDADSAHLYLHGGARLPLALHAGHPGRLSGIAETSLSDKAGEELAAAIGLRWQPHPAITLDVVALAVLGGTNTLATPAALRVNLGL